jgi:hypothetical protein
MSERMLAPVPFKKAKTEQTSEAFYYGPELAAQAQADAEAARLAGEPNKFDFSEFTKPAEAAPVAEATPPQFDFSEFTKPAEAAPVAEATPPQFDFSEFKTTETTPSVEVLKGKKNRVRAFGNVLKKFTRRP